MVFSPISIPHAHQNGFGECPHPDLDLLSLFPESVNNYPSGNDYHHYIMKPSPSIFKSKPF